MTFCLSHSLLHIELSNCVGSCELLGLSQCCSFLWDFHRSSYVIFKTGNPRANCTELSPSFRGFMWVKTSHGAQHKGRQGAVEYPSCSLGAPALLLSDGTSESCHVEFLTVVLTSLLTPYLLLQKILPLQVENTTKYCFFCTTKVGWI